jgi:hypothetical protein
MSILFFVWNKFKTSALESSFCFSLRTWSLRLVVTRSIVDGAKFSVHDMRFTRRTNRFPTGEINMSTASFSAPSTKYKFTIFSDYINDASTDGRVPKVLGLKYLDRCCI